MERAKLLELLRQYRERNSAQYGINRIGIFGSYARGNAIGKSDVDVVVEMNNPDIFAMVHIKEELEKLLNAKVDVIRNRQKMNPYLKKHIEKEAIYV